MRKFFALPFITILLLSCEYAKHKKKPLKITDSILQGRWASLNDTSASFSINKGEIFYYEPTESYKYSLFNDTIKIRFNGYNYEARLKMKGKDTLITRGIGKFRGDIDTLRRSH